MNEILTAPIQFNSIKQDDVLVHYSENKPENEEIKHTIDIEKKYYLQKKALHFLMLYDRLDNDASY